MDLNEIEIEGVDWIYMAQDRDQKQVMNTVKNHKRLGISYLAKLLLASHYSAPCSLLHFNIILPSMHMFPMWYICFMFLHPKFCMRFLCPHSSYMPHHFHSKSRRTSSIKTQEVCVTVMLYTWNREKRGYTVVRATGWLSLQTDAGIVAANK
jgi:hypothetical protein